MWLLLISANQFLNLFINHNCNCHFFCNFSTYFLTGAFTVIYVPKQGHFFFLCYCILFLFFNFNFATNLGQLFSLPFTFSPFPIHHLSEGQQDLTPQSTHQPLSQEGVGKGTFLPSFYLTNSFIITVQKEAARPKTISGGLRHNYSSGDMFLCFPILSLGGDPVKDLKRVGIVHYFMISLKETLLRPPSDIAITKVPNLYPMLSFKLFSTIVIAAVILLLWCLPNNSAIAIMITLIVFFL